MGNTTCVTSNASGITKANASELEGKKVAVPLGTMADYVFAKSMEIVGVDASKINVIDMVPEDGTAALISGDVAMACLFGGNSVQAAVEVGSRLISEEEAEAKGILGIDITSVTNKFMNENPGMVRTFVEVTHEANARYNSGKSDMNSMTKASGMEMSKMKNTLDGFKFLTPEETKKSMENGNLSGFLDGMGTPSGNVDTSFLPL